MKQLNLRSGKTLEIPTVNCGKWLEHQRQKEDAGVAQDSLTSFLFIVEDKAEPSRIGIIDGNSQPDLAKSIKIRSLDLTCHVEDFALLKRILFVLRLSSSCVGGERRKKESSSASQLFKFYCASSQWDICLCKRLAWFERTVSDLDFMLSLCFAQKSSTHHSHSHPLSEHFHGEIGRWCSSQRRYPSALSSFISNSNPITMKTLHLLLAFASAGGLDTLAHLF